MQMMTAADVIRNIAIHGEETPFWARANDKQKWTLLSRVSARGIEYGMRDWQFYGPVVSPDQMAALDSPLGWAVIQDGQVCSVRRFEPAPMSEAAGTHFIPLFPPRFL